MGEFPQTPYFVGLNEPVGREVAFTGLEVEGTIPEAVRGSVISCRRYLKKRPHVFRS